jgi:hypothetical protein
MSKLVWDEMGKRLYETGVKMGVLYPWQNSGLYSKGVAWNGLTTVTESPSGAEASPQYADDIKYLNLISAEEFGATIEAFTYPDEFAVCDGSLEIETGVIIGQQSRKSFGLSYRTTLGNDVDGTDHGYKLHLIYGALAAPSEKGYATINDSPEAITFSWEVTTTPVAVTGFKPTASLVIDSTKVDSAKLAALELILYGNTGVDARLPLPDEIASIFAAAAPTALTVTVDPADEETGVLVSDNVVLTFNNKISEESIIVTSSVGALIPVVKTWDITGKILTINPTGDFSAATMYLVTIVGVIDVYNQSLAPSVINFTTAV